MITQLQFRIRGHHEDNADGSLIRLDLAHILPPIGDDAQRLGSVLTISGIPAGVAPPVGSTLYAPLLTEEPEA